MMNIKYMREDGYEQVVEFSDDTGFLCFIALHNTKLGPALGGCRLKPYVSPEHAIIDVLRLAEGMTYKSSLAGLNFGGGKCVVVAERPTREIMLKVGAAVNHFGGRYVIAEDVGTTLADIAIAGELTPYINRIDGSGMTARGVLASLTAAAAFLGQWDSLDGVPIWIQGLGKVGMSLAERMQGHLNLYVSDLRAELVAQAVSAGAYEISESDRKFMAIYAPCAMGQVVTPENVAAMSYSIICGSANNQLTDDACAEVLHRNHVLYCPDWLVNAGGVISAAYENGDEFDQVGCEAATDRLGQRLTEVLEEAAQVSQSPLTVAKRLAESRFL